MIFISIPNAVEKITSCADKAETPNLSSAKNPILCQPLVNSHDLHQENNFMGAQQ